jgi:hypothetical protein
VKRHYGLRYYDITDRRGDQCPPCRYCTDDADQRRDSIRFTAGETKENALRHGHAVWALSHAGSVADLKAVSQNLMHRSLFTTDEIYGVLTGKDTRERRQPGKKGERRRPR